MWPTPAAADSKRDGVYAGGNPTLGTAVRSAEGEPELWPTPRAGNPGSRKPGTGGKILEEEVRKWPTPRGMDGSCPERLETWLVRRDRKAKEGINLQLPLQVAVQMWPTPRTITGGGESGKRKKELGRTKSGGGDLQSAVQMWPTPTAGDAIKGPGSTRTGTKAHAGVNLHEAVHIWPTPRATDGTKGSPNQRGSKGDLTLPSAAAHWPTPNARDWKDSGPNVDYEKVAMKSKLAGAAGGSLNPTWVEWLMGFPLGWTDFAASETLASQAKPSTPSESSGNG
jgi:hypothetical protein